MAAAKYNTAEHKHLRAEYGKQIAAGYGWCVEPICLMPSRVIPPDTPSTEWHVPHNEDGVTYRGGPAHRACNAADGGRRRHEGTKPPHWVL